MNEILDCKRMMFGKLWKELWSFYAGHWWLFRITKTWSENRQQVENFQYLVSKLSIARQNAVSQSNNILTDRNFIWFCGKNLGDTISLVKCSTVISRQLKPDYKIYTKCQKEKIVTTSTKNSFDWLFLFRHFSQQY